MQNTDSMTSQKQYTSSDEDMQEIADGDISSNSDSDQSQRKSNQNTQTNVHNQAQQYTSTRVKYFPWRSWHEWSLLKSKIDIICDTKTFSAQTHHKKTKLILEVIRQIQAWESKNTHIVSSAQNASPHTKYLKMQKILLQEKLCQEKLASEIDTNESDSQLGSNMRLIQLVEMGASTNKYRKSKQGGKLAMKNIAEELNFPQSLVSLRHQAVHESRDGSSHSPQILAYAFRKLQKFIDQNYWRPISSELERREVSH